MGDGGMSDEEFKQIDKEIKEWNKLRKDIREKVDFVTVDNYDEDSIIFRVLKIEKKKDKNNIIKFLSSAQENFFSSMFSTMTDYFEKTLRKNYVFIENISVFNNMFGIIEDRIKSNKNSIKDYEKKIKQTKNKIVKSKDYDKSQELKWYLYRYEDHIKENEKTINLLESQYNQLKGDIKELETSQSIVKGKSQ